VEILPVVPVALPLLAAAIVAAAGGHVPHRVSHAFSVIAAAVAAAASIALLIASRDHPILYWFGGWAPRDGVCLGIGLAIDPLGAGLAALSGVLVVAALVFASAWFDAYRAHFHALVLAFLAALSGFGLTGDLFNLFVFFELMSAAAFALTGFKSRERGPIQGAINFAVTNTFGAVLVLLGIALLYGRTGALNLAQIGRALGDRGDALPVVAFALITCGFSIKAALVPFHFWLADAHAVAPAPVSVIFSGVMVEAGLYAVVRIWGAVFHGALGAHEAPARGVLLGFGAATALVGGVMCVAQRHLKRMLAFSTISHVGAMCVALATLDPAAVGGAAVYALGHGFAKAALFLCAGVLLHRCEGIDEIALRGRGRAMPFVGVVLATAGIALAGMPPFGLAIGEAGMDEGVRRAGIGWASAFFVVSAVLTGATVLRAAGRVFLGLGPGDPDAPEVGGETTEPCETEGHHGELSWTMRLPPAAMLALSLAVGLAPGIRRAAREGAALLLDTAGYAAWVLDGRAPSPAAPPEEALSGAVVRGLLTSAGAVALASLMLFRERILPAVRAPAGRAWGAVRYLRALHTGRVGDYVAWLLVGVATFGGLCALLR
jgi:multicomponent Na+:H+ antiporter subunit D